MHKKVNYKHIYLKKYMMISQWHIKNISAAICHNVMFMVGFTKKALKLMHKRIYNNIIFYQKLRFKLLRNTPS